MVQDGRLRCELAQGMPEQEEREAGMRLRDATRACSPSHTAKLPGPDPG
jgi:hypothetical protein